MTAVGIVPFVKGLSYQPRLMCTAGTICQRSCNCEETSVLRLFKNRKIKIKRERERNVPLNETENLCAPSTGSLGRFWYYRSPNFSFLSRNCLWHSLHGTPVVSIISLASALRYSCGFDHICLTEICVLL